MIQLVCELGVNFSFLTTRTPNAEVVGLDPNPSMEQYAQQAARDTSLKDFHFVTGYGESMPFETNTFDVAIGTLVRPLNQTRYCF